MSYLKLHKTLGLIEFAKHTVYYTKKNQLKFTYSKETDFHEFNELSPPSSFIHDTKSLRKKLPSLIRENKFLQKILFYRIREIKPNFFFNDL